MERSEEHWEAERRLLRDEEREPRRAHLIRSRPRRMSALATIHTNIAAGVEQGPVSIAPRCMVGATSQDGSSLHLCQLPEGHVGPHVFPPLGSR